MRHRTIKRLCAVLALSLLLTATACGVRADQTGGRRPGPRQLPSDLGPTTTTDPNHPIPHPRRADQLVVSVSTLGPWEANPAQQLRLPSVSVFGDGTVIRIGGGEREGFGESPTGRVHPAIGHISEDRLQRLLHAAADAGLPEREPRIGTIGITDQLITTIHVATTERRRTIHAYALATSDGSLTGSERAARARLLRFFQAVMKLVPAGSPATDGGAASLRWAVLAERPDPDADPEGDGDPAPRRPWPLADPGRGTPVGGGVICTIVDGRRLIPVTDRADQDLRRFELIVWTAGRAEWVLRFRPMLPDEHDCYDAVRFRQ